jgi:hypothetical protein
MVGGGVVLLASIVLVMILAAFMTLTFLAASALTFLLGVTWLSVVYTTWAITSVAGVIVLRRLARMLEHHGINSAGTMSAGT